MVVGDTSLRQILNTSLITAYLGSLSDRIFSVYSSTLRLSLPRCPSKHCTLSQGQHTTNVNKSDMDLWNFVSHSYASLNEGLLLRSCFLLSDLVSLYLLDGINFVVCVRHLVAMSPGKCFFLLYTCRRVQRADAFMPVLHTVEIICVDNCLQMSNCVVNERLDGQWGWKWTAAARNKTWTNLIF